MSARTVTLFAPAKINIFLAVTARRSDGFHDLVSLTAPLQFGDTIWLEQDEAAGPVQLRCNDPAVPSDDSNLAVRAAEAFRQATDDNRAVVIELHKRIPMGAGLGGGSSNAAAVLRGMNHLAARPLPPGSLHDLAAHLGSDCPLFLADGPCIIRGRGEQVTTAPTSVRQRLKQQRVLLFKPDFAIRTAWAYQQLSAAALVPAVDAEQRLATWIRSDDPPARILVNSFEPVACRKFIAVAELLDSIRRRADVDGALLSGSGSASFVLPGPGANVSELGRIIREALGPATFIAETAVA